MKYGRRRLPASIETEGSAAEEMGERERVSEWVFEDMRAKLT